MANNALLALPLVVNGAFALLFFATLLHGKIPLITAIAQIEQGECLRPDLTVYTRRLTAAWGVFLLALGIGYFVFGSALARHSGHFALAIACPFAVSTFFALEFAWRTYRFPDYHFLSPLRLLGLIRKHGGMIRLFRKCMA